MKLRLSARKSDLARIQAYLVGRALQRAHPGTEIEYRFKESLGDVNQHDPLWKMPERGVFTDDFLEELRRGDTDLVVHSWKDLPTEDRVETEIAGTLPRADARDLVLVKKSSWERVRREGRIRVYSSSPRRAYNLDGFFKEYLPARIGSVEFIAVRGNVPTRLRKLFEDDSVDALIVAKAALDRLIAAGEGELVEGARSDETRRFAEVARDIRAKLTECRWIVLPLSRNPSAAAQGALAVEIARERKDLRDLLSAITCRETESQVRRERAILQSHGGGCHQKIGVTVLTRPFGDVTFLRGLTEAGRVLDSRQLTPVGRERELLAREKCWPLPEDMGEVVERRPLEVPAARYRNRPLWVARADALPAQAVLAEDSLVWTAGLDTWKKLASRGVWVNGSAEGLGENEDCRVDLLHGSAPRWLKLTHAGTGGDGMEILVTYEVLPKKRMPDFFGKEFFYWRSGTGFLRALEANPWLAGANHFCGPGNTYRAIRDKLGADGRISIELSHADWIHHWVEDGETS